MLTAERYTWIEWSVRKHLSVSGKRHGRWCFSPVTFGAPFPFVRKNKIGRTNEDGLLLVLLGRGGVYVCVTERGVFLQKQRTDCILSPNSAVAGTFFIVEIF